MIVKIMRYNGAQQYWLYDNVAKISVSNMRYHSNVPKTYDLNLAIFDIDSQCTCPDDGQCTNCVAYYKLILRLNNGDEYSIAFDTVAYILNDEGKTIEKIVANYYPEQQVREGKWKIYETDE
jgi:hypothetical protein